MKIIREWEFSPLYVFCTYCYAHLYIEQDDIHASILKYRDTYHSVLSSDYDVDLGERVSVTYYVSCAVCEHETQLDSKRFPLYFVKRLSKDKVHIISDTSP